MLALQGAGLAFRLASGLHLVKVKTNPHLLYLLPLLTSFVIQLNGPVTGLLCSYMDRLQVCYTCSSEHSKCILYIIQRAIVDDPVQLLASLP